MSCTSIHKDTYSLQGLSSECVLRKIIHVDMDAFYASVEQRDNPAIRGLPVIVGGEPNGRGVVAACSYEARQLGIHSAMPSAEAGRRCPQAIFVKPRFSVYQQVSLQIHEVFRQFTALVEPLSLDEAYLDVSDNTLFDGSAFKLAREIKSVILERTQLIASAGVSYNKFLAKIASDFKKPDGLYCILPEQGEAFVAGLPVGHIHGVGKVTEARMHELGIFTGLDLRQWSLVELTREFGKSSEYFYRVARGVDHRPVRVSRTRQSYGAERTFSRNLHSVSDMLEVLYGLSDELLQQLGKKGLSSTTLTLKVRFADFSTFTRAHTSTQGVFNASQGRRAIPFLLEKALQVRLSGRQIGGGAPQAHVELPARDGVRLLGVAFRGLCETNDTNPVQMEIDWD